MGLSIQDVPIKVPHASIDTMLWSGGTTTTVFRRGDPLCMQTIFKRPPTVPNRLWTLMSYGFINSEVIVYY